FGRIPRSFETPTGFRTAELLRPWCLPAVDNTNRCVSPPIARSLDAARCWLRPDRRRNSRPLRLVLEDSEPSDTFRRRREDQDSVVPSILPTIFTDHQNRYQLTARNCLRADFRHVPCRAVRS